MEKLDFDQPNLQYAAQEKKKSFISLVAYFDPNLREETEGHLLTWLSEHAPQAVAEWSSELDQDWLREWKKNFKSFYLSGLHFTPSWEKKKKAKTSSVIVEPGMAFGTGTHATTQFCIQFLDFLRTINVLKNKTVLDVGAGSGILSVTAERLGARSVLAVDNDPEAWRESEKMFRMNKTKKSKVTKKQINQIDRQFDVVLANIIDGVLMNLKKELWRAVKPGGYLILSGILEDGSRAFIKSFLSGTKSEVVETLSDEEWTAFLIGKH